MTCCPAGPDARARGAWLLTRAIQAAAFAAALPTCGRVGAGDTADHSRTAAATHRDSTFAAVQTRGAVAMGVDQYTSHHRFDPLEDGGRIVLQREAPDSAGTDRIRKHMAEIATRFAAGDFSLPGFVHARDVPGTAVMVARRSAITYAVESLPRGAALRVHSDDRAAIAAIHQFLAFQRHDHHVAAQSDS